MEKTRNLIIVLLIVVCFLIGFIVLSSNTPDEYKIPDTLTNSMIEKSDQIEIAKLKEGFLKGCMEEAADQKPYCECTFNYLLDNFGIKGTIEIGLDFEANDDVSKKTADNLTDAIYSCIGEFQY